MLCQSFGAVTVQFAIEKEILKCNVSWAFFFCFFFFCGDCIIPV